MSILRFDNSIEQCGIVVDIGSGSVGIAVVISDSLANTYEILWSHREHMLIKDASNESSLLKDINTVIINAFLELGSSGLQTIHKHERKLEPKYLQVAISAPWSYTVTKHIKFEDEHPFEVSKEMLENLVITAEKENSLDESGNKVVETLGLRSITEATVNAALNGYLIKNPIGNMCRTINLSHITALAHEKILQTLEEVHSKIVPKTKMQEYSFMYIFYQVLRHLHPNSSEACLIDITNEATEIGIIRDDTLSYTTHAPVGLYTLAREITKVCNIPKEEAYNLVKNGTDLSKIYTAAEAEKIELIFANYRNTISELFKDTGDALSIPKTLFIHTTQHTESFFSKQIKEAAESATNMQHFVHLCTSELLNETTIEDTALAVSVHFFHHKQSYVGFEHKL